MDDFQDAIHQCGFKDIGYYSLGYTWCNIQEGDDRVYLRLDSALATPEWNDHYKDTRVHHLVDSTSDHCTLLVSNTIPIQPPRRQRFHFEAMWTQKEECKNIIKAAQEECTKLNTPNGIAIGLKQCASNLAMWNKATFGQVLKQIYNKRKTLNELVLRDHDGSLGGEINKIRKEISDLLDSEEIMWHQRSKVQWLSLGDCNTKYFHSKASERKKKNTISRISDEDGNWCQSFRATAEVAISYFEKLYTTSNPSSISKVTSSISIKVTEDMNQNLMKEFTTEEIDVP